MQTKIMIISDEHDTKPLYIDTLESQGYNVVSLSSGKRALKAITKEKPDCVLLGIMIADMDGLHILEWIRSNPKTENLKVIVLSAITDEKTINRAFEIGADDYLIRGEVALTELLKRIDRAISRS